jgi:aspartyl/asparaginyl-tRNA synthetase
MAWIDSVDDVMRMEEELLAHAIAGVRDALGPEIRETLGVDLVVPPTPFPRMTLAEARGQLLEADYPVSVRPFYHMRRAGAPTVTSSFDLLWNGLEATTGAQREHRYDVLVAQAGEKGVALGPVRHYVDCLRYGCPPHGGLGIGVGRLLMTLLELPSIREATLFFRGPHRLIP